MCRKELSSKLAAPAPQGLPADLPLSMEYLIQHAKQAHDRNLAAPQYHLAQHPLHFQQGPQQVQADREQTFSIFCSLLDGGRFHLRPQATLILSAADSTIQNVTFVGTGEEPSLPKVKLIGRRMKARNLQLHNCTLVVAGIGTEVDGCYVDCANVANTGIHVDEPQTSEDKRLQRMMLRHCHVDNAVHEGVRVTCSLQVHLNGCRCATRPLPWRAPAAMPWLLRRQAPESVHQCSTQSGCEPCACVLHATESGTQLQ